ncbi:MAG TPA: hypothetical protein PKC69_01680 [Chitinophagaceae bacterium]|nr:hypothetical protein [Chitinophagaceae bacterium]
MRKFIAFLYTTFIVLAAAAQSNPVVIDSFKTVLGKETVPGKRISLMTDIARLLLYVDMKESESYGQMAIEAAERTRDRRLITQALMASGQRYAYLSGRKENVEKSVSYYTKALEVARENKLEEETIAILLGLSEVHRFIPDLDKSLSYCNQAYSYASIQKNDSITLVVHLEYGTIYLQKREKILSLRHLLTALRMAEELKNKNNMLRNTYILLSAFYADLKDYDKAIDYATRGLALLDEIKTGQSPYNRVQDLNRLGNLYSLKKSYSIAMSYYEESIALADSLKFSPLKALAISSIVRNYLESNQPRQALEYFNKAPQLIDFLKSINFHYFIDLSYGQIYTRLGIYDSAKYYYDRVAPFIEKDATLLNQLSFYAQSGLLYKASGQTDKAISYFLLADEKTKQTEDIEQMSYVAAELDTLYQRKGNYQQAMQYASLNFQYKDSLSKLAKEKDLMQAEAADEQQRQERLIREAEEKKNRRHSIQYRIITIGVVSLIIGLVMLGMFKVSATTIRMLAFFTFIFVFEFIFLLLKKQGHSFTEGEPWKDLLLMIVLAAVLLPLHHWLEHKVIAYLTSHNRLTAAGQGFLSKLFKRKKQAP